VIEARISPVSGTEVVPLKEADDRILAHDVCAPIPLPRFVNSAVDGYAIRDDDLPLTLPKRLKVVHLVRAGREASPELAVGEVARVFTGAPLPEAAVTVVMQEDVVLDLEGYASIPAGIKAGANVRQRGEDVAVGDIVLGAGCRLRPQEIALAAAIGMTRICVVRRINVAVLSTGNELVEIGTTLKSGQVFDSNRPMLVTMLERLGCRVTDLGICRDNPGKLSEILRKAASEHDLVVTSGGASVGDEDHVKKSIERLGELLFWKVAIKPGRPVAFGTIGGTPTLGLPGNPVATFVTFALLASHLIAALSGSVASPSIRMPVRAGFSLKKTKRIREFIRVSLRLSPDGAVYAVRSHGRSASLPSLVASDGFVEVDEDTDVVNEGENVAYLKYTDII
jgi:molybdopterin molybdotransferase